MTGGRSQTRSKRPKKIQALARKLAERRRKSNRRQNDRKTNDTGLRHGRVRHEGRVFSGGGTRPRVCRHADADDIRVGSATFMTIRTSSKTVTFAHPFMLKAVDRILAAGEYRVVTDEELIEGLSFPVYRRVATMIFLPAEFGNVSTVEMVTIDPEDLQAALELDLNHGP
jgi:hypothetical protein